jgi:hypothetical protein
MNAQRILIHEDKADIQKIQRSITDIKIALNNIYSSFIKMDLGSLTITDFYQILNNPKEFYNKRIDENLEIPESKAGKFSFKKDAILEQLNLPSPKEYLEYVLNLEKAIYNSEITFNLQDWEIIDNSIKMKDESYQLKLDNFRTYASDAVEIKLYQILDKLKNDLIELDSYSKEYFDKTIFNGSFLNTQNPPGIYLNDFFLTNTNSPYIVPKKEIYINSEVFKNRERRRY